MLKKNKYYTMLLISVMVFVVAFIIMYYIVKINAFVTQDLSDRAVAQNEKTIDVIAPYEAEQVTIEPYTHIKLLIVDDQENIIETKALDPLTLIGLDEETLKKKFEHYELTEFTSSQVVLQKTLDMPKELTTYTLGVQDNYLCIIDNEENRVYTKLNILATHFSRTIYSALLKEEITITKSQRDKLLADATYIETILQSYENE